MLPDFVIVGAMKAGTSSLAYSLGLHPEIFVIDKEVHFFDKDQNYCNGLGWYESHFINAPQKTVIGEKTPTYSYLPYVASRMAKAIPNAKLIWIFRNPVDRTYSNYWHAVKSGIESLNFQEALDKEEKRLLISPWLGYRKRSIYIEQVRCYLDFFPMKNMLFLLFENLVACPEITLRSAFDFLGVNSAFKLPETRVKKNTTYIPRSIRIQKFIRKSCRRGRLYRALSRFNRKESSGYPQMEAKTRVELQEFFASHNVALANLINLDLDKWQ